MQLEVLSRKAEDSGGRPPLLFVHGSAHAAWCWDDDFLPWFASAGFDSYAISVRGHGKSEGADGLRWASVRDYVDDVREVARLFPAPPVLIGHSLGGLVVQKYLERFDAHGAILLASSPVGGMLRSGARLFVRRPILFAKVYLTLNPGVLYGTRHDVRDFLFSAHASDEAVGDCARRLGPESFRAMFEMTHNLPDVGRIRRRRCPMLVIGGGADVVVPPHEIEATAAAYGAPCTIFPDIGHDLMLDVGWESVAEHMQDWLAARMSHAVL